ncbi:2-acylglycerol O-acyltransferase 2-like [Zophobas morio]|uniref:2-acylglycerol O-acyltransferase 2-like n=1 Tax=Zophobas morio TaxID=2755281 RepID=UPI003082E996
MGMGLTSSTAKSLNYILSRPEGGRIVVLSPGGAMEAYYGRPQKYTFLIKERKGFIKMALRHGSPLVLVIAFGEPDLFEQVICEKLRSIQEFIRKYVGIAPVIFYGTGFLFLGKAIEVEKVENPTNEEIDSLHAKFVQELKDLFDLHKDKFLEKPDDDSLQILGMELIPLTDELHQKFIKQLVNLFDTYKYDYLVDPEAKILELE